MTSEGEQRRARLGEAAVDAARTEGASAPAPGPELFDSLAVLFGDPRFRLKPAEPVAPEQPSRDDVA